MENKNKESPNQSNINLKKENKKYEFGQDKKNYTSYSDIYSLSFYILGDNDNMQDASTYISKKELFKDNLPINGGVYDASMGTTSYDWLCATCYNPKGICPGHSGALVLKYPVKSPLFRDEILKWLKIICFKCGSLLITKDVNSPKEKIMSEYVNLSRNVKECSFCKNPKYAVSRDKHRPLMFFIQRDDGKKELFNHQIKDILSRVTDESVLKLKKPLESHPKKLILQTIRIAPNGIRPDVRRIGGTKSNNSDITALIKNIVEINENLPFNIPPDYEISKKLGDLYFSLDMFYSEMIKGSPSTSNKTKVVTITDKAPKSLKDRIPKKTGRIRKNLMGKRTRFMMRSVVSGDNSLKVDELGVPISMAMDLQIPETVRSYNKQRLNTYFNNKRDKYPGCVGITLGSTGSYYKLEGFLNKFPDYELELGDIVYRDIIEGDIIGFNRQPSLLFSNISAMKVKIMKSGLTLRMNVSSCNAFNADFDGDAMNALVSQNVKARVELENLSWLGNWMISYQNHAPMFGCFQDSLVGSSEITKSNKYFNKWKAMNMFSNIEPYSTENLNFEMKEFLGRNLIKYFIPPINYPKKKAKIYLPQYEKFVKYDPEEKHVQINRGDLISGSLDKSTIGQGTMGSIFHIINNEYGAEQSLKTIFNFHQLIAKFFLYNGFTIGIRDVNISEEAVLQVKNNTKKIIEEAREITEKLNNGELIAPIGTTLKDFYESEQMNALEQGDDFVQPILNDINFNTNKMARLVFTGSKGKTTNVIAINGAIGTQTIGGLRPPKNFSWGRTSPYFQRYDTDPRSLGYIDNSFKDGIESDVFPFAAQEARYGLISNALSTSISGTQNRLNVKNTESIAVDNLRKAVKNENIIQFLYADAGIDTRKTEKVKFLTVLISDDELSEKYHTKINKVNKLFQNKEVEKILDMEFEQIKKDRECYRNIFINIENNNPGKYIIDNTHQMPINPFRIIEDVIYNYSDIISELKADEKILDPVNAIKKVSELCENIAYSYYNSLQEQKKMIIPEFIKEATLLLKILIRTYLCTSNFIRKGILNFHLDLIIEKIRIVFRNSLVDYGATVGIIAAQCISEPMTQYVLDSKHRSGGGGGTKTNAIERIQEIMGAKPTEKMKNTSMTIMIEPQYEKNKNKVQEIANYIEMMDFKRFVSRKSIFYEEYGNPIHPEFVHEINWIRDYEKYNIGMKNPSNLSKWCIRWELNKEEMIINSMKLETIIIKLRQNFPDIHFIYTPENSDLIVIRGYIQNSILKIPENQMDTHYIYENILLGVEEVVIRGISNILYTEIRDIVKTELQEDGSLQTTKVYCIETVGTNLEEVLENPFVDPYRTQTDSIKEFEDLYGIDAARNKIINEIRKTMSSDSVTYEHTSLFADEMTYSGQVTSIQRAGLQKREMSNVTLRLSFQSPIQVIEHAAKENLVDYISSVSGPLIVGQTMKVGTNYNPVSINENFVENYFKNINQQIDDLL